ncbi:hypothetical protein STRMOE7_03880 [Streptomyces sp. MOE7]|nr:hypothetical protein STRMOE7_03880 [Streptomyces sp. MOE7]
MGWVPDRTGGYRGRTAGLVKPNGPLGAVARAAGFAAGKLRRAGGPAPTLGGSGTGRRVPGGRRAQW